MVNLTVNDLIRFQTAGVAHEAEINAAEARAAAAELNAARYEKIRSAGETRKLRIIQRLIQSNSATDFDAFMDNLGA